MLSPRIESEETIDDLLDPSLEDRLSLERQHLIEAATDPLLGLTSIVNPLQQGSG